VAQMKRAIMFNGIGPNYARYPDLTDRIIAIRLRRLENGERQEEKTIRKEFEDIRPNILGAVFTALVNAFAHLDQVREDLTGKSLPRMADWAVWGEAIARGLGIPPFKFINAYHRLIREATITVIEELPLGRAMVWFAEKLKNISEDAEIDLTYKNLPIKARRLWIGTARQLMKELEDLIQENGEEVAEWKGEGFPKTVEAVGKKLRELIPNLNDQGIKISFDRRRDGTRIIKVMVGDDSDGSDDSSAVFLPSKSECGEKEEEKKSDREGSNNKKLSSLSSPPSTNTTPPLNSLYSSTPEGAVQPVQPVQPSINKVQKTEDLGNNLETPRHLGQPGQLIADLKSRLFRIFGVSPFKPSQLAQHFTDAELAALVPVMDEMLKRGELMITTTESGQQAFQIVIKGGGEKG
ncbi:MAG: hypothetical protein QXH08_06045, partial [Candidatus Hadarchaeales archaeon]